MNYKIGCFQCGVEDDYNIEETTTNIICLHCGYEASAFSLLFEQIAYMENKIAKLNKE